MEEPKEVPNALQSAVLEFKTVQEHKKQIKLTAAPINKRQKELNQKIITFMQENDIDRLNMGNEALVLYETERKATLNAETLPDILASHPMFKDKPKAEIEALSGFVFDNRPVVKGLNLKRIGSKSK